MIRLLSLSLALRVVNCCHHRSPSIPVSDLRVPACEAHAQLLAAARAGVARTKSSHGRAAHPVRADCYTAQPAVLAAIRWLRAGCRHTRETARVQRAVQPL